MPSIDLSDDPSTPSMQAVEIEMQKGRGDAWRDVGGATQELNSASDDPDQVGPGINPNLSIAAESQPGSPVSTSAICGPEITEVHAIPSAEAGERIFEAGEGATAPITPFVGNDICTYKYPWLLFIPMNLWEQVHPPLPTSAA